MPEAPLVKRRQKFVGIGSWVEPQESSIGLGFDAENGKSIYNPKYQPPRQFINPIQGLTPARAIQLMTQSQIGYFADLQWTYKVLERRNPTLRVLKERRLAAIGRMRWTIRAKEEVRNAVPGWKLGQDYRGEAKPSSEQWKLMTMASQQMEVLRSVYTRITNFNEAIRFMALATFRGYSHLEKHVDGEGNVTLLQPVPQYHWAMQYPIAEWLYNDQALQTSFGSAINPEAFVIREVDDPLNEIAVILHLRQMMTTKDWDCFCETFGIPSLFAQVPKDVALSDTSDAMQKMDSVIANGRGVLTHGATLASTSSVVSSGTAMPFEPHIRFQIEQLVLAGTGGKLTMLSDATGIGTGATSAHEAVFNELAEAEGEQIAEVFRTQCDIPELKRRGYDRPLVEFALELLKPQDRLQNAELLQAIAAAGYRVSDEQASELLEMDVTSVMQEQGPEDDVDEDEDDEETDGKAKNRNGSGAPFYDPPPYFQGQPFADRAKQFPGGIMQHFPRPVYEPTVDGIPMRNPDSPELLSRVTYPSNAHMSRIMAERRKAMLRYQQAFANGVHQDLGGLRKRVRDIIGIDNPRLLTDRLRQLQDDLPSELKEAARNKAAATILERAITEAINNATRR